MVSTFMLFFTATVPMFVFQVLYLALEKRYNFSVDDLDVVANGYLRFRSYVRDENGKILFSYK